MSATVLFAWAVPAPLGEAALLVGVGPKRSLRRSSLVRPAPAAFAGAAVEPISSPSRSACDQTQNIIRYVPEGTYLCHLGGTDGLVLTDCRGMSVP
jgi:hypothetical protein